jgi:hypothetical protein
MELIKFRDMNDEKGTEEVDAFGQSISALS